MHSLITTSNFILTCYISDFNLMIQYIHWESSYSLFQQVTELVQAMSFKFPVAMCPFI